MRLADIINDCSWLSVEIVFSKIYPDDLNFLEDYENVFYQLKYLKPIDTNITIIVSNEIDTFDNEHYVSVSGYDASKKKALKESTESLALEFTPWDKWLGMNIDQSSLDEFSSYELICHCLHEMTLVSFDQEEIKDELDRIKQIADDYKNMTEEEKNKNSISLEDLMNLEDK